MVLDIDYIHLSPDYPNEHAVFLGNVRFEGRERHFGIRGFFPREHEEVRQRVFGHPVHENYTPIEAPSIQSYYVHLPCGVCEDVAQREILSQLSRENEDLTLIKILNGPFGEIKPEGKIYTMTKQGRRVLKNVFETYHNSIMKDLRKSKNDYLHAKLHEEIPKIFSRDFIISLGDDIEEFSEHETRKQIALTSLFSEISRTIN